MIINELKDIDIEPVVKIHQQSFKDFFLTTLGTDFLMLYYKSYLKCDNALGIGVFDENSNLLGFAVAAINAKGFNKKLLKSNLFRFGLMGIKLLLKKPNHILRIFNNMEKKSLEHKEDKGDYAELFSIAINPKNQGMGLGKILLSGIESNLKNVGCKKLTLTTDYYNNDATLNFYKKSGYSIYYEFMAYPKRKMYKLIKTI